MVSWSVGQLVSWHGGGGHSGLNRYTHCQMAVKSETVNAKIQGRSTPFRAKKGGGQLQTRNIIGAL